MDFPIPFSSACGKTRAQFRSENCFARTSGLAFIYKKRINKVNSQQKVKRQYKGDCVLHSNFTLSKWKREKEREKTHPNRLVSFYFSLRATSSLAFDPSFFIWAHRAIFFPPQTFLLSTRITYRNGDEHFAIELKHRPVT